MNWCWLFGHKINDDGFCSKCGFCENEEEDDNNGGPNKEEDTDKGGEDETIQE